MFHVLAGRVEGYCGDESFGAGPGDFLFLPRDVEHALTVVGDGPARLLTIIGPARFDGLRGRAGDPARLSSAARVLRPRVLGVAAPQLARAPAGSRRPRTTPGRR